MLDNVYFHLIKQDIFIRSMVSYVGGGGVYLIFILSSFFTFNLCTKQLENIRKDYLKMNVKRCTIERLKECQATTERFHSILNLH